MTIPEVIERPASAADRVVAGYVREFAVFAPGRRAAEPAWVQEDRRRAIEAFERLRLPTTRHEEWRFTPIAPIAAAVFPPAPAVPAPARELLADLSAGPASVELVFVNGVFAPTLSRLEGLPEGVRVESLAAVLARDGNAVRPALGRLACADRHAFTALNAAFFVDGAAVSIPDGVVVDAPLHLVFLSEAAARPFVSHPRVLIVAGAHSQARIVETYAGRGEQAYWTNAVSELVLGDAAVVEHYRVQRESARAFHLGSMHVRCGRGSAFSSHAISLGGALVRNEVTAVLDDEGATCTLGGLYAADGDALVDNHTTIDHAKPHCTSHELYKGVLGGRARGVFNGKIVVRPDAQKTDAKQTNKALLLSDHAMINSKPQLEIFANDVKCTHGAAVGQLDDDAVFYLRARGLDGSQARRMLIQAFVREVLDGMRLEPLRAGVERTLMATLSEMLDRQVPEPA